MMVPWPPGRGRGPASRSGGPSPRRTRRGSCASTTSWNPGASAARCCAGKGFTPGASFSQVLHFGVFRSCGEVEVFDGGRVVAAEVVFVAVAVLVVVHVWAEVAVDDDGFLLVLVIADNSAVGRFHDHSAAAKLGLVKIDDLLLRVGGEVYARHHRAVGHIHLHAAARALRTRIGIRAQFGCGEGFRRVEIDFALRSLQRHLAIGAVYMNVPRDTPDAVSYDAHYEHEQHHDDRDNNQDDLYRAAAGFDRSRGWSGCRRATGFTELLVGR